MDVLVETPAATIEAAVLNEADPALMEGEMATTELGVIVILKEAEKEQSLSTRALEVSDMTTVAIPAPV